MTSQSAKKFRRKNVILSFDFEGEINDSVDELKCHDFYDLGSNSDSICSQFYPNFLNFYDLILF